VSLKRDLLVSFGLQGAGAAAVLLATLLIGARLGPAVQGGFSHVKAEVDFLAAFAMFGLPQALFFHVKSGRMGVHSALRWALGCALLALPLAALYASLRGEGGVAIVAMSLAVGTAVAHGQLRALLLVHERTEWFNVLTALPQVLVLAGVGVVAWRTGAASLHWIVVFAMAYAVAAAISWGRLRATPPDAPRPSAGWRALVHYGMAAWLTAALATAAILLAQRWVELRQGRVALGQFTMAMTLVQVPLTPISYAAPMLLRRWMERPGAAASRRVASLVFGLLLLAAALAWLAAIVRPDLGLGPAYDGSTRALAVLLVGGAAEAASRILTVQASARGTPWIAVQAEAARWTVLVLGWQILGAPPLLAVCAVWAAGAWAAAGVFAWHARIEAREAAT
jgi:hypothetical protein